MWTFFPQNSSTWEINFYIPFLEGSGCNWVLQCIYKTLSVHYMLFVSSFKEIHGTAGIMSSFCFFTSTATFQKYLLSLLSVLFYRCIKMGFQVTLNGSFLPKRTAISVVILSRLLMIKYLSLSMGQNHFELFMYKVHA